MFFHTICTSHAHITAAPPIFVLLEQSLHVKASFIPMVQQTPLNSFTTSMHTWQMPAGHAAAAFAQATHPAQRPQVPQPVGGQALAGQDS